MRFVLAALLVCTLAPAACLGQDASPERLGQTNGKFIVHEWGTFTGFAGSDGVHLPFGVAVGGELPEFVLTRRAQAERQGFAIDRFGDLTKGAGLLALQRMETPVVYFYTDQPKEVAARVDFPRGLLSEFYPPVRAMTPPFGEGPGELKYLPRPATAPGAVASQPAATRPEAKPENSSLDWGKFLVVPQLAGQRPTFMPNVSKLPGAGAHYEHARATDAATIQFSDRPGERHDERFLFYRGLGDFSLPVTLTAPGGDRFELASTTAEPIGFAILLHVDGRDARFAAYTNFKGTQPMTLPAKTSSLDEVAAALVEGLIGQGLFEREARAMVATWRHQWLAENGTRVLYTVPRATTDALLPLTVTPAPDRSVRVLVGRIDVMTPELEAQLQQMLAAAPTMKELAPDDVRALRSLGGGAGRGAGGGVGGGGAGGAGGRFVVPAIERAVKLRGDAAKNPKRERDALRALFWNLPRPVAAAP